MPFKSPQTVSAEWVGCLVGYMAYQSLLGYLRQRQNGL